MPMSAFLLSFFSTHVITTKLNFTYLFALMGTDVPINGRINPPRGELYRSYMFMAPLDLASPSLHRRHTQHGRHLCDDSQPFVLQPS